MRRIGPRTAVLLAVPFALFVIACGSGSGHAKDGGSVTVGGASSGATSGATGAAKAAASVGKPVRDGKFEFTVTKLKCGVSKVGDSVLSDKAQGQFCLVTMKVRNIGKEAQLFDASSQFAFGATGAKYDADSAAGIDANNDATTFLDNINPGNSVTGIIVFDIPKSAKIVKLELHDSPFSDGVTVTVK